jgi:hypothetical protein
MATDVKVYFCDPQSPWQRGSNENTNGLSRQCFPRRTDLSGYTQADLDKVALRLNQRRQAIMIANVLLEGHQHMGVDPSPEIEEALAKDSPKDEAFNVWPSPPELARIFF